MIHNPRPSDDQAKRSQPFAASVITLPKGGGAIRGMGEKFAANPVTGTSSLSVLIAASPGRSGFRPQLALSYDSGSGNGPFGFGWNLSLPSITRKTEKGLPQYRDAEKSNVLILSGAEDLVSVYRQDPAGSWIASHPGYQRDTNEFWVRDPDGRLIVHENDLKGYRVRRYRPRIEGLFTHIERWTGADGDVRWRSLSKDKILTIYGQDENARIADLADPQRNRGDRGSHLRTANRYLKRIRYGNRNRLLDDARLRPRFPTQTQLDEAGWMLTVVFNYGEHAAADSKPDDSGDWLCRQDLFSSYRVDFEPRTNRLYRRRPMFQHFSDEAGVSQDCRCVRRHSTIGKGPSSRSSLPSPNGAVSELKVGLSPAIPWPPLKFKYSQTAIGKDTSMLSIPPASRTCLPMRTAPRARGRAAPYSKKQRTLKTAGAGKALVGC